MSEIPIKYSKLLDKTNYVILKFLIKYTKLKKKNRIKKLEILSLFKICKIFITIKAMKLLIYIMINTNWAFYHSTLNNNFLQ